jgi:hypothetical protein
MVHAAVSSALQASAERPLSQPLNAVEWSMPDRSWAPEHELRALRVPLGRGPLGCVAAREHTTRAGRGYELGHHPSEYEAGSVRSCTNERPVLGLLVHPL